MRRQTSLEKCIETNRRSDVVRSTISDTLCDFYVTFGSLDEIDYGSMSRWINCIAGRHKTNATNHLMHFSCRFFTLRLFSEIARSVIGRTYRVVYSLWSIDPFHRITICLRSIFGRFVGSQCSEVECVFLGIELKTEFHWIAEWSTRSLGSLITNR